jgi:2-succinyl-6-hydroxy-2,4-cyclohexadiene-1-carboxylate synthase
VKWLVLHGFAGSPRIFSRFFRDAAMPDLPGHGDAADASGWEAALDALEKPLAHVDGVFGYSMGARLALALALRHRGEIGRVVLESGTPGIADVKARARRQAEDDELAAFIEKEGMQRFVERWERHPTLASLRPFAAQLRAERLSHRPRGLASALRHLGAGAQPSYWEALAGLQMKVSLIAGATDEKFARIAAEMQARLPRADLVLVDDAGHAPHLEQPEAFAAALAQGGHV